ncbi:arginase family protein [Streptomyces sp. INA 01156]
MSALRGRKVHVSLDIDVLDPVHVPDTGSREPFGPPPAGQGRADLARGQLRRRQR